jgi:RHS repeat-associated protein
MKKLPIHRYLCLMVLPLLISFYVRAAVDPPVLKVLDGNLQQIKVDSIAIVEDSKFFDPAYNSLLIKPYKVRNNVTLKINESALYFLQSSFSATVQVRVICTRANLSLDSVDKTLTINYKGDSIYTSRSSYVFGDAYRVKIKVLSVSTNVGWDVWKSLMVSNELQSFPAYNFSCINDAVQAVSNTSVPSNTTADELPVTWGFKVMADEYDLEWTYVDSSALASGRYGSPSTPDPVLIFENNSSRVSISGTSYNIPLIYDGKGTLFYRVRSVQYPLTGTRAEAHWSSEFSGGLGRFEYDGHQRNLNWQSTISYAENGLRKISLDYYSGSLFKRQTVTKDNSTNTTVVAETYYDYQGRPAINVLPTPTLDNIIKYTPNFNVGINAASYDVDNFDYLTDPSLYCSRKADPMDTTTGAARYYSPANPEKNTGMHQFIPDSKGYPFKEMEYTQDNTGRLSSESGVGPSFTNKSGHETKYFYGTPDQKELDALFGTEAGHYSHYFKNMVRDGNGQYSVTYLDMYGRKIATALAGSVPDSIKLDTLVSKNVKTITETLSTPESNVIKDLVMESKKGLLVSSQGNHVFSYQLTPQSLTLAGCNAANICYDCLYDLEISITDDCNNQKLGGHAFDTTIRNFNLNAIDTTCSNQASLFSLNFTKFLVEGSYEVTKKLSISRYGMDYYRDSVFIKKNTCITLDSFIKLQRQLISGISNCTPTCQSCIDSLGTWDQFRARFMLRSGIAPADSSSYRSIASEAYTKAKTDCDELCNKNTDITDIRKAMLNDLISPSGQYANIDSADDVYSIYYNEVDNNDDPSVPNFRKPTNYKDADGNPDLVYDEQAGTLVPPQQLGAEVFSQKFKLSWAEALLPYHPEYCKLVQYEALALSHEWDRRFEAVESFSEAMQKGYLNPTNNNTLPFSKYNATLSADQDPLSNTYNNGTNQYKTKLENQLKEYRDNNFNGSNGISMWGIATIAAMCKDNTVAGCYSTFGTNGFDTTIMCVGERDMAWRAFRQMYLDIKREIIYAQIKTTCNGAPGGIPATTLFAAHHQPHFSDAVEALQSNGTTLPSDINGVNNQQQQAQSEQAAYYQSNCAAYVTQWWRQLKPCNYTSTDSAIIVPRLIQVCIEGSDGNHPAGASGVRPGSTYKFKSFRDVLQFYADSLVRPFNTNACNPYLITAPPPYDKPISYGDVEVWTKPDSCQCSIVTKAYASYQLNSGGAGSFSAYVNNRYGVNMSENDLQTLRGLCNNSITCNYLPSAIIVPSGFQCGSEIACATCEDIAKVYSNFQHDFMGAWRLTANDSLNNAQYRTLFTNYFNAKLGYQKAYQDYVDFLLLCNVPYIQPSTTAPITQGPILNSPANTNGSTGGVVCDTLQNIVSTFNSLYPGLSKWNIIGVKRWRTFNPKIEFLQTGGGIQTFTPSTKSTHPLKWYGTGQKDLGYGGQWYRDSLTFVMFDFGQFPRNATIDSVNLKLARDFSAPWLPEVYWCNMATIWDTAGVPLGISFPGNKYTVYTPMYQTTTGGGNIVYTYDSKGQMSNLIKFNNLNKGQVFTSFLNPAVADSNSASFFSSFNPITQTDPETRPHVDVLYRYDTIYKCEDLITAYFNYRLRTNLTYDSIKLLYLAKCGIPLPITCAGDNTTAKLCGRNEPLFPNVNVNEINNCSDTSFFAISTGTELYNSYRDSLVNVFDSSYRSKCMQAYQFETFTVTHQVSEYHHTLYFYNRAGNLVKTVPPEGVHANYDPLWLDSVRVARTQGTVKVPVHSIESEYRYNTLESVIAQWTPDASRSDFWYDRLGRLVLSQNSNQRTISGTEVNRRYSYTLYDNLGRIIEVGEIKNATSKAMHDSISRNQFSLNNWITNSSANKGDISQTNYDVAYSGFTGITPVPVVQVNLRNRVSFSSFTAGNNPAQYNQATFYTYDFHGNIDTLLQDYGSNSFAAVANVMNANGNRFKKFVLRYDLVTSKLTHAAYQPGMADQFYHRYTYDAENRLTMVETSSDSVNWEKEARYQYYKHGPLARTVLGDQQVQGIDFGYTLQGWMKGVNSTSLNPDFDMGNDGKISAQNQYIARDVYGLNVNYFSGDYAAINNVTPFPGTSAYLGTNYKPLFNGNISSIAVNIGKFSNPLLYAYTFDQLNRITGLDAFKGLNESGNNWSGLFSTQEYKERVAYDANGNITKYLRNGFGGMLNMDSLTYNYNKVGGQLINNQLNYIRDNVTAGNYTEDLDNQAVNNYGYDSIGNLVRDNLENITLINWNAYGKITEIQRNPTGSNPVTNIQYTYDALGNRVSKRVAKGTAATYTWYVRDAQGNIMATYTSDGTGTNYSSYTLLLSEQDIYGSSRLGVLSGSTDMKAAFTAPSMPVFKRGFKSYELVNHLGNVLVTISDKKLGHDAGDGTIDYFTADVLTANDYYPFGMVQPGRKFSATTGYRYGFGGKENDVEAKGEANQLDYGHRIYDPRAGRFLTVDPIAKSYPELTPYQYASNKPINGIDLDGLEWILKIYDPQAITDFVKAGNDKDIYKQRGIAYQAINNKLSAQDFLNRSQKNPGVGGEMHGERNSDLYLGGELVYDKKAPQGVTFTYQTMAANGVRTDHTLSWDKGKGQHYDDPYPVDVRSVNSPEHTNFYGSYDFVGTFQNIFGSAGAAGGAGTITGYLKGYGRVNYTTQYYGAGTPGAGVETGGLTGNFNFKNLKEFYTPNTIAGYGGSKGWGAGIASRSTWYSFANYADWKSFNTANATISGEANAWSLTISFKKLNGFSAAKLWSLTTLTPPIVVQPLKK